MNSFWNPFVRKKANKITSKKNMNWNQAKRAFPRLSPFGDADRDGVINRRDCRPFNRKRQDDYDRAFDKTEKRWRENQEAKISNQQWSDIDVTDRAIRVLSDDANMSDSDIQRKLGVSKFAVDDALSGSEGYDKDDSYFRIKKKHSSWIGIGEEE